MAAIVAIETHHIRVPFDIGAAPSAFAGMAWTGMETFLLRVIAEDGAEGWGEGWGHAACAATRKAAETLVAPLALGAEAADIRGLHARIARALHLHGRSGTAMHALSALDIALWDLAGKAAGLPLSRLLGAVAPDHLVAYASLLRYGTPEAVAAATERAVARGYRSVKLHEVDPATALAARAAAGAEIELTLDTNCPWTVDEAIAMAHALRPAKLAWLEEPVWPPENHDGLRRARKEGGIPLAAGENAAGVAGFRGLIESGAVDILQPSVTKCGGVTTWLDIAALARAHSVRLVPHCAYFGMGYLASLHLGAAFTPGEPFERLFLDLEASPWGAAVEAPDARAAVPAGPGVGPAPDPAILRRYAVSEPLLLRR